MCLINFNRCNTGNYTEKLENKEMSNNLGQQTKNTTRVRSLFVAALVLACAFGTVTNAVAQNVTPPPTPDAITPPAGNTAYAVGHAFGSQGYVCLPTATGGTSWTVNPARPEATLFVDVFGQPIQIITHFASIDANPNGNAANPVPLGGNATWQSSFDSSKVWAAVPSPTKDHTVVAGTDPASCPNSGAIPCLLLQSVGNQQGPTGGKFLAKATFVQRLNTKGGAAPTTACTVGQTQLQGYTADYFFYRADQ
jgi:hypothetical protein